MTPPAESRDFIAPRAGALILGLQFLLLVFRLGHLPLLGPDEPRYARVAIEMARADEFVTPTLAGEPWLEKPPLYYWMAGAAYRAFGENEFAARLPAVLAAILMTGMTGVVAARLFGEPSGRLAMMIVATAPLAFIYGKAATMDLLVAAFITTAIGLFLLRAHGIAGPTAIPAAWAAMALALLAKGPIGFLIPAGFVALLCVGARVPPTRLVSARAVIVFLAIGAPWFIAIYRDQGFHFIEVFILNHNLQRFTSTIHNHPGPPYYYLPVLLLGLFPWSILGFPAAASLAEADRRSRFSLAAWILIPLALFSAAGSKLPGYILPCIPPLAIVLSLAAKTFARGESRIAPRVAGLTGLTVAAIAFALVIRAMRSAEPWGRPALLPAMWLLATLFLASRALERVHQRDAIRVLSIGAAGLLLLLNLVAPPVAEALESGRLLFAPANGREVVAVGAWRTAWMAGYFYNDGRVREADSYESAMALAANTPQLFLLGPGELDRARASGKFTILELSRGPRGNVLARLTPRPQP